MLRVHIDTSALGPMADWLKRRRPGEIDRQRLGEILDLPPYQLELARFGAPGLPVCGITREEAEDYFLHFDEKRFEKPRLQSNQELCGAFYADPARLDRDDLRRVERLLEAALPESMCREDRQFTVVVLFSIGNSQGYPWGDSIVFDAAKMDLLADRDVLLHVIAHELHHILFPSLLPETLTGQEMYAAGLAAEAAALLAARYEQPVYTSRLDCSPHRVTQYPVYYLGCFLWGLIDLALGKDVLLHTLKHPAAFARTYNRAAEKLGVPWCFRPL